MERGLNGGINMRGFRKSPVMAVLLALWWLASLGAPVLGQDLEFFEKKVRPLLSRHCYSCHSSQATPPMGRLRLDTHAAFSQGGTRGAPVVPGDPDRSLLIQAVTHQDPQLRMPPAAKLADNEISILTEWVLRGAVYPGDGPPEGASLQADGADLWSFKPLRVDGLPKVEQKNWPLSPVDHFVLARLENRGLRPAPPADRRTWIRRVSYDLTGLPPTPEEVADFLADRSRQASRRVVERLLASPHYGERWARHWLDLVRFAETNGHEFDTDKLDAWRYRDYVIRAFNQDIPYDQFVREQVAGDLLPEQRLSQDGSFFESPLGTALYWFGELINGPTDSVQARADQVDNQIDVLGKSFLGLTIACARCHDHKFDPVSTQDYYALAGILHSSSMDETVVDSPVRSQRVEEVKNQIAQINDQIVKTLDPYRAGPERLKDYLLATAQLISPLRTEGESMADRLAQEYSLNGDLLAAFEDDLRQACRQPDHPFYPFAQLVDGLASGRFPSVEQGVTQLAHELKALKEPGTLLRPGDMLFEDFEGADFSAWTVHGQAFGDSPQTEIPPHQFLRGRGSKGSANSLAGGPHRLVGSLTSESFRASHLYLHVRMAGTDQKEEFQKSRASANRFTMTESGYKIRHFFPDGGPDLRWHTARMDSAAGRICSFEIVDRSAQGHIVVDKIVLSDLKDPPRLAAPPSRYVIDLLHQPGLDSLESVAEAYRRIWLELALMGPVADQEARAFLNALRPGGKLEDWVWVAPAEARERVHALQQARAGVESEIPVSAFAMATRDHRPRNVRLHIRGSHKNLGQEVPRGVPHVRGIEQVSAVDRGSGRLQLARWLSRADHPLTARVMANRIWKHHFGEALAGSPDNLGRMGQRPTHSQLLDFLADHFVKGGWSVKSMHRMIVLSATYAMSGEVDPEAAGSDPENRLLHHFPLRRAEAEVIRDAILAVAGTLNRRLYGPSVPPHISDYQTGRGRPESGPLDGQARRTIYVQVRRNFLTPLLLAFDYPPPISSIGRRNVSNVSSQALILLNNEFVAQQARQWAQRSIARQPDPRDRLEQMYRAALARPPEPWEAKQALEFVESQSRLYGQHPEWLGEGNSVPQQVWAELGQVIFNSSEFIYFR